MMGQLPSLPQPVELEEWMASFYVYVDDSGKFANPKSPFFSFCGYVAHASEVERFSLEWLNLRYIWQVPAIHMSAIMHPEGDAEWQKVREAWGAGWEVKRDRMILEFSEVIRHSRMVCVGAVVDAKHYRSMRMSKFTKKYNPQNLAFLAVVMKAIKTTEVIDKHTPIGVVVDDDREASLHCYEMLDHMKQAFPVVRERIGSLCFVNDNAFPVVQAADMIAFEARKQMEARVKNPDAKSSELFSALTRSGLHQPKLITGDLLDKWGREGLSEDALAG
jgi:hypothetical protein